MHLKNSGKKIVELKFKKDGIEICFDDETNLKINSDTFSSFYLYESKVLSEEEILEIEKFSSLSDAKKYVLKILNERNYTEKQIYNKLKKRKYNQQIIDEIIAYLKENKKIDDHSYVKDATFSYNNKNYGKNRILEELTKDGIDKESLSSVEFDDKKELQKAINSLEKFSKKQSNKSLNKIKQDAYSHLLYKGFDEDIASRAIEQFSFNYDYEYEKEILRQQINKYIVSHHLNENLFADKQKIISYFVKKGFNYDMIINLLGGKEDG
ncbi:MAG: regulatory protein RecX [Bacilli bacterium]